FPAAVGPTTAITRSAMASGRVWRISSLLRVRRGASRGVWLAVHPSGRPLATAWIHQART
ncbi:MAG TPA: hypothetical protein VEG33_06720, partial [Streptosporangiaceae bacterium]|nr:hypothetical protein [Streptosporangiaceae bacterium]